MAKFIDLFSGLGGFNIALTELGHECVFASEIDQELQKIYLKNFGITAQGDIRKISITEIPKHDILCAGFPCQPFSKAGNQKGFEYPELGPLYTNIIRIINFHKPEYFILENVPNLRNHSEGKSWELIRNLLVEAGYKVDIERLSPHQFGVPQIRNRIYIVGSRTSLNHFSWPRPYTSPNETDIFSILDEYPEEAKNLSDQDNRILDIWQEFLNRLTNIEEIPHPLWAMEFGATYPYKATTPYSIPFNQLRQYKGSFGIPLIQSKTIDELFKLLPSHAQRKQKEFPAWKITYIEKNRQFYEANKTWIDEWKRDLLPLAQSYQKLEWNVGFGEKDIRKYIIQKRPSGIRVKKTTTSPSLVAMTSTQVPIISWENRYMTPIEGLRLQSMDSLTYLPETITAIYRALGNAVNVKVVKMVAEALIK